MGKGIGTKEERLNAMAEAYMEAAEHLKMNWTGDELEWECGKIVSEILEKTAVKFTVRAFKAGKHKSPAEALAG